MRKALTIAAVIGLIAPLAMAQDLLVATYAVERDNFNIKNTSLNDGHGCNGRWAKADGDATHYADWSEADLQDLKALIASAPPAGYTGYEVRYAFTGAFGGFQLLWQVQFGAFASTNDWNPDESGDNRAPALNTGASDLMADDQLAVQLPWVDPGTGAPVTFWGLPELTNSVPFIGWRPSTGPGDVDHLQAVVDQAVLDALIDDPLVRGLRCHSTEYFNEQVYARGQWGTSTAAAKLLVYAVPEPASLLLVAFGGVGLLLRKKR